MGRTHQGLSTLKFERGIDIIVNGHSAINLTPVLPKSRHTLKIMVSGLFVEFEITVNHIYDIIVNTVTMRT